MNMNLAAMTGIQGVSSSEWFPISQSVSANRPGNVGSTALSYKTVKETELPNHGKLVE